ncbi:MAG TPA: aminotransferase class V-fold PLP-dependent enzyme, partial [Rhizomicrobium sp.]|nr:aminotransferase class V-fold PLP-dependent enzyme [Rhizomicrobium sp.]
MSSSALRVPRALPNAFLPYGRQLIEEDDIAAVTEALRGDLLTTGPFVERFETALAKTVGAKHAVVCANGTAALHMAARALNLGPGTKVIVPVITFLATASAPHLNGAEIVFADVDPDTGLMRPEDLEAAFARAGHADAVFNVHVNGQCGDIEAIAGIARAHGAKIVDDACHAIGTGFIAEDGSLSQIGSNTFCDLTVFSVHPVKTIAMGEGGAVTANDPELAARLI